MKPQRMANWPPLKSCCSLCLASLLSFTMATTEQWNEEPPQQRPRRDAERERNCACATCDLYGRGREATPAKAVIRRPSPCRPWERVRCWFAALSLSRSFVSLACELGFFLGWGSGRRGGDAGCFALFLKTGSLFRSSCSRTHEIPAAPAQVLELKVCTGMQ